MISIGVSFHTGELEYDAYETALQRRANALGIAVQVSWLAGAGRPFLSSRMVGLDGLCFTGGADVDSSPERDLIERALLEYWDRRPVPLLAICRGAQLLNVFRGGSLIEDLGDRNALHRAPPPKQHPVQIRPGTRLAAIAGSHAGVVDSSHHQAVDRLADGLMVSATAPDGIIEAYEFAEERGPLVLGVQWHPELMAAGNPLADGLLDAFVQACARSNDKVPRGTLSPNVPRGT